MPYIKQNARPALDTHINNISYIIFNSGELTYVIYKLLLNFIKSARRYESFALAMGILSCVKSEFYRQEIAPYEDVKIVENGDVKDT